MDHKFKGSVNIGLFQLRSHSGIRTLLWKSNMAFVVQADAPGTTATSVTVAEREEAFDLARRWIKSGYIGVKVIGDGRIYLPPEFEKKDPA
jgi:hypothetical protein